MIVSAKALEGWMDGEGVTLVILNVAAPSWLDLEA